MIVIRELTEIDMLQAMELKALCWPEELAGLSDNRLSVIKELEFWTNWMQKAEENDDVRLLIGAFEDGQMLGVAFGSFAEIEDIERDGIDLNGLWVYKEHRGRGISLMLLVHLLDYFINIGKKQMTIYNFHHSSSNSFYRKYGAYVIREDFQMKEQLPVDVFICDIKDMKLRMEQSLIKYNNA